MALNVSLSSWLGSSTPAHAGTPFRSGEGDEGNDRDRYIAGGLLAGLSVLGIIGMAVSGKGKDKGPGSSGGPSASDGPFAPDELKKMKNAERLDRARKLRIKAMSANRAAAKLDGDEMRAKQGEVHAACSKIMQLVQRKSWRGKVSIIKGGESFERFARTQLAILRKKGFDPAAMGVDPLARAGKKHKAAEGDPQETLRLRKDLAESNRQLAELQRRVETVSQELTQERTISGELRRDIEGMGITRAELERERDELKERLKQAGARLDELRVENRKLTAAATATPDMMTASAAIRELQEEKTRLEGEVTRLEGESAQLRTQLKQASRQKTLRADDLGGMQRLQAQVDEASLLEGDLHGRIRELAGMVQERDEMVRERDEAIAVFAERNEQQVTELASFRDIHDRHMRAIMENEQLRNRMRIITESEGETGELIKNLQGRIDELEGQERKLRQQIDANKTTIVEFREKNRQLEQGLETSNAAGSAVQGALKSLQGEHAKLQGLYDTVVSELQEARAAHARLTEQHEAVQKRYGELMVSGSHTSQDLSQAHRRVVELENQVAELRKRIPPPPRSQPYGYAQDFEGGAARTPTPPPIPDGPPLRRARADIDPNRTLADRVNDLVDGDLMLAFFDDADFRDTIYDIPFSLLRHTKTGAQFRRYIGDILNTLRSQGDPSPEETLAGLLFGVADDAAIQRIRSYADGSAKPQFYEIIKLAAVMDRRLGRLAAPAERTASAILSLWNNSMTHDALAALADEGMRQGQEGWQDAFRERFQHMSGVTMSDDIRGAIDDAASSDPQGLRANMTVFNGMLEGFEGRWGQQDEATQIALNMTQRSVANVVRYAADAITWNEDNLRHLHHQMNAAEPGQPVDGETLASLRGEIELMGELAADYDNPVELSEVLEVQDIDVDTNTLNQSVWLRFYAKVQPGLDKEKTQHIAQDCGIALADRGLFEQLGIGYTAQVWGLRMPSNYVQEHLFRSETFGSNAFAQMLHHIQQAMFGYGDADRGRLANFLFGVTPGDEVSEPALDRLNAIIGTKRAIACHNCYETIEYEGKGTCCSNCGTEQKDYNAKNIHVGELPTDDEAVHMLERIGRLTDIVEGIAGVQCCTETQAIALSLLAIDRHEATRGEINLRMSVDKDEAWSTKFFEQLTQIARPLAQRLGIGNDAWVNALALIDAAAKGIDPTGGSGSQEDLETMPPGTNGGVPGLGALMGPDLSGAAFYGQGWCAQVGPIMRHGAWMTRSRSALRGVGRPAYRPLQPRASMPSIWHA